jgi:LCP family protein required for cell wall assembly
MAEESISTKTEKRSYTKPALLLIGVVSLILLGRFWKDISKAFDPVSIVASVGQVNLKETDGRTNVLVLGSDVRTNDIFEGQRTDSILVASIGNVDNDVVLISIPRDLWVQSSAGATKINAVYSLAGVDELKKVVGNVLGIPIHYNVTVTFDIFKEAVDILGGIEVTVENSFTDRLYPIAGKENAPENERYETVIFTAGVQKMNGETALKYVRSRHGDNNEGTDFARSKRQQKVISALKDKVFSTQTFLDISKLQALYETYSKNVETNVDIAAVQSFAVLAKKVDLSNVVSVVLDDRSSPEEGGLLYNPPDYENYGGQYVLIPRSGDFSQIKAYVQKYLFEKSQ